MPNVMHRDVQSLLAFNPVEVLNEHLSQLVGCYVSTKVIHVHNKDKPWFDEFVCCK